MVWKFRKEAAAHVTEREVSTGSGEGSEVVDDKVVRAPESTLQRQLRPRHIQMIAIGGVIGTGLFLGIAKSLQDAGPAGLLISYCIVATLLFSVMVALGEMVSAFPIPGGHLSLISRFHSRELGFAIGWLYWYCYIILLAAEISAAAVIITYWTKPGPTCQDGICNNALWVAIMLIVVIAVNFLGTRVFGEIEFWAASIKVITIIGLIIVSIVITAGGGPKGEPIGFRYWNQTGGFVQFKGIEGAKGRFLGFFSVLITASFALLGSEMTALAAAESANPARAVPKAIKTVYVRLVLFYISSAFLIGLLVSPTDPSLNLNSTAAKSPFVIAIKNAGIAGLPSVINAALLTSAWSAGIAVMYISSRTLYGLYTRGDTPRFLNKYLGRLRKRDGLPWVCVAISALFSPLSFFAASPDKGAGTAFGYFANMTAVCGILTWACILLTYIRFHRGMAVQGIDRRTFPYVAPLQPYLSYYGLFVTSIIIVFSGFTSFIHKFDVSSFITTYFPLPFFAVLIVGYKVINRPKTLPLAELDYVSGSSADVTEPPKKPVTGVWGWLKSVA